MRITVARNSRELGEEAANLAAEALLWEIAQRGWARLALSTGASQLDAISALSRKQLPWSQVELFQVNERVNLPDDHSSSCRKALKERFARRVSLGAAHYLDGSGQSVAEINRQVRRAPIDVALLGLGRQGQVGFNTAPADLECAEDYTIYPAQDGSGDGLATMTLGGMMRCKQVIVCAPYGMQAENIRNVLTQRRTEQLPVTALKQHDRFDLLLDTESAAQIDVSLVARCNPQLEAYRVISEILEA